MSARIRYRGAAITISCSDLERSIQFYENVLGAARDTTREAHTCPWFTLGPISFSLMPNAEERSPALFPEHAMAMLWLDVEDLEAANRRFLEYGVEILQPSDSEYMLISDPDGILIEVWQFDPER